LTSREKRSSRKKKPERYHQLPDRIRSCRIHNQRPFGLFINPSPDLDLNLRIPRSSHPSSTSPSLALSKLEKLTVPNPQKAHRILQHRLGTIVPSLVLIGDVPVDEDLTRFPA
jgi:hypothetical protein